MRLPDNLSAKEKKEWIAKYKAMGIKIDTTNPPIPDSYVRAGFTDDGSTFRYNVKDGDDYGFVVSGAWTNDVDANGFDLIDTEKIKAFNGFGIGVHTTEPPIDIMPAVYGARAWKAHAKEAEAFINSPRLAWDEFSIDFAKKTIRVHKKIATMELYKKLMNRFNQPDCIDEDLPMCLIPVKLKGTTTNDWEIQGIDVEAEFYID